MMKRVLVLAMVLGMISLASAGLQISVNGDVNPVDSQIVLKPSDTLILDIHSDAPMSAFTQMGWVLVVNKDAARITGGYPIPIPNVSNTIIGNTDNPTLEVPQGKAGHFGSIFVGFVMSPVPAGKLYDGFVLHCVALGDAVVQLYQLDQVPGADRYVFGQLLDTVVIHQIPEPITMTLLGLGGLFLRRRK